MEIFIPPPPPPHAKFAGGIRSHDFPPPPPSMFEFKLFRLPGSFGKEMPVSGAGLFE